VTLGIIKQERRRRSVTERDSNKFVNKENLLQKNAKSRLRNKRNRKRFKRKC